MEFVQTKPASRQGSTEVRTSKEEKDLLMVSASTDRSRETRTAASKNRKLFLFEIGQLSVTNQDEADRFVADLTSFLVKTKESGNSSYCNDRSCLSLPRLKEHVKKHNIGKNAKVEEVIRNVIDICDARYDSLRKELVEISKQASTWITQHLMKSHNVVVANRATFVMLMRNWERDPCNSLTEDSFPYTMTNRITTEPADSGNGMMK